MKTEVVRVRLTELERDLMLKYAAELNLSISDYIKYCCLLNKPVLDKNR